MGEEISSFAGSEGEKNLKDSNGNREYKFVALEELEKDEEEEDEEDMDLSLLDYEEWRCVLLSIDPRPIASIRALDHPPKAIHSIVKALLILSGTTVTPVRTYCSVQSRHVKKWRDCQSLLSQ